MNPHRDCIWTERVAEEWIQGHPIGNGRLGAMVLGRPQDERLALNHDRLWRRYWQRQPRRTAADLPRVRELCAAGRWDEAFHALDAKIIPTGRGLYVNPFVPLGDLWLRLVQPERVTEYRRGLDLDAATAWVTYVAGGVRYARRAFASAPHGLIVLHLTADHAGALSGEVALSRLLDPDCVVDGGSALGEVALWGEFEEGVRFAAVAAVRQSGGRLTGGRRAYQPPEGAMPPKDLGGIQFIFRDPKEADAPGGASTCFDAADEVSILVAMAAGDDFAGDEPAELIAACRRQIAAASGIEALYPAHLQDHRRYYRRVELNLGDWTNDTPTDRRLDALGEHDEPPPELAELQFKLGRYLAVSSSRPGTAPMNLQGVWNQDRRPAWDSDYHLDMNLQMCYWPLPMANLADCMRPVFDWADAMLPQAREAASDLYGCRGIAFPAVNDLHALGNADNLCFWWTGAAAWLGQLYWQYFAYTGDVAFLRERAVPFLEGIAEFYEDFLSEDADGRRLPIPSMSPEVGIKGGAGFLSPPSTMDLELVREVFTHLLEADRWTPLPPKALARWRATLARVPEPRVGPEGQLLEWWADVEPADPGHRHLSHLIGLTPGDRITRATTPEAFAAAALALAERARHTESNCAWSSIWKAHAYVRLHQSAPAAAHLTEYLYNFCFGNLLSAIVDWRDRGHGLKWFPGHKVYQIDASLGVVSVIAEAILQDRGGELALLPALPRAWADGSVRGLRARGGFEVDLIWRAGLPQMVALRAENGGPCRIRTAHSGPCRVRTEQTQWDAAPTTPTSPTTLRPDGDGVIALETRPGDVIHITWGIVPGGEN